MKCAIFLADGFETCEGLMTIDMLRRAGITIDTVSISSIETVTTSHGVRLFAEFTFNGIDPNAYDALILPGGKVGTANLEACEPLKAAIKKHFEAGKLTCAICAAPSILGHMGLLEGRKYTCYPDFNEPGFNGQYLKMAAVTDGNLITGRGMGASIDFAANIIEKLMGEETLRKVFAGMQYDHEWKGAEHGNIHE